MLRPLSLRVLALSALLLPASGTARAQTIGGRVIDAASRLPTRLLTVEVLGDSDRIVTTARTDTTGVFYAQMPTGGAFRLRFALDSLTTFDTDTIRVQNDEFVQREFIVRLPRVLSEREVEKHAKLKARSSMPRYPKEMMQQGVEGEVLAQFVVDSAGLVRLETFRALRSPGPEFTQAVREWLPSARFYPAEVGGRHVAQMVQQPFTFSLGGRGPVLQTRTSEPLFPNPPEPSFPRQTRPPLR